MQMKMSILLGVTHMNFGILNSLYNNLFFRCGATAVTTLLLRIAVNGRPSRCVRWCRRVPPVACAGPCWHA